MKHDTTGILSTEEISCLLENSLKDPFSLLGMHRDETGVSVRTVQHRAVTVAVRKRGETSILCELTRIDDTAIFTGYIPDTQDIFPYDLAITYDTGYEFVTPDPYSFLPVLSEDDLYLFNQGNNNCIYEVMGAHTITHEGVTGTQFALWAPNADRVSVVGNFNLWDGRQHPMRMLGASGIWEIFIPYIGEDTVYKYEIRKCGTGHLTLKTDPYGYRQEPFPNHGSIVSSLDRHEWQDELWLEKRAETDWTNAPMLIYELHLGSWKKNGPDEEADYCTYQEIGRALVPYLKEMNYTHVEFMPVQEHPFVPSWGYQVGGFYAVNHRFGTPQDFQELVDYLHQNDIGVILDWVPGHFPKDEHVLSYFDGTHLYEHQDPREGFHTDWGTLIFNFGRNEVRNFLVSNALFWIDKFHIDGLRIDAVASMLYRNYSREEGEWIPNHYGGVENLEAIDFLRKTNDAVHAYHPGVLTIAEESTAFPGVTAPTNQGGLGFDFKWNMGWMHDTLEYFEKDPIHRKFHQGDLTYCLWYAFSEKFMLVLSHDEVVHGKKSLLEKMPGDDWQKFANLRMLYGWMYGHPGKKLLFMGGEFGMRNEWYEKREIDWWLLDESTCGIFHSRLQRMVADLNQLYLSHSSLWNYDYSHEKNFQWVDYQDRDHCVLSFTRGNPDLDEKLLFVFNLTPVVRHGYTFGIDEAGYYEEIFNSNAEIYGGEGMGNFNGVTTEPTPIHGRSNTFRLDLPPLAFLIFKIHREG
ncbi:1,4-alpha-glucan branching protein GlgB [Chitinivibrio alkaliphilus]|uniref:1,4-alpha-glucan branching enzyme GlgB n=1 Tax=Chitinivibrio alkaliphilus ACht1 TaxID=1313304 RepID=U7DCN9_9BACT|nr:1,4-alpha-glucan branching protein GlgB [Chitinivibrio alkaliphilus]ERP32215.1 1,4-alpha-glucan branching enzyme [Chitinivibrio alkaliphilus ACht1]